MMSELITGPWVTPTLGEFVTFDNFAVRLQLNSTVVQFRGRIKATAGFTENVLVATLPAAFHPTKAVFVVIGKKVSFRTSEEVEVDTEGHVIWEHGVAGNELLFANGSYVLSG